MASECKVPSLTAFKTKGLKKKNKIQSYDSIRDLRVRSCFALGDKLCQVKSEVDQFFILLLQQKKERKMCNF